MVSGSAPLSPKVMTFFRCLLGVPVCEGYGQTEGSAAGSLGHPEDMASVGHVGGPHKCVEIVLVDVPEMGYLSTGEIWKFPRINSQCMFFKRNSHVTLNA